MIKNVLWMGGVLLLSFVACSEKSDSDDGQPAAAFDVILNGKILEDKAKVTVTDVSTGNGFPQMSFVVSVKNNRKENIRVGMTKQEITFCRR